MAAPRDRPHARTAALLTTTALLTVCATAPEPTDGGVPASPVTSRAVSQGFALEVSIPRSSFLAIEPIPVTTTLTWTGAAPIATIRGPADGPVSFSFEELTGRRAMGGAMPAACIPKPFERGVPVDVPFRKGAGQVDDAFRAFYDGWFAEARLRLPRDAGA